MTFPRTASSWSSHIAVRGTTTAEPHGHRVTLESGPILLLNSLRSEFPVPGQRVPPRSSHTTAMNAKVWHAHCNTSVPYARGWIEGNQTEKAKGIMLRRTMLRAVAVIGMLGLVVGSASAHGPRVVVRGGHGGYGHVGHHYVQRPYVHVHRQPVYVTPSYGYGMSSCSQGGYGGSPYGGGYYGGYGSSYGGGIGYSSPSFGIYYSR